MFSSPRAIYRWLSQSSSTNHVCPEPELAEPNLKRKRLNKENYPSPSSSYHDMDCDEYIRPKIPSALPYSTPQPKRARAPSSSADKEGDSLGDSEQKVDEEQEASPTPRKPPHSRPSRNNDSHSQSSYSTGNSTPSVKRRRTLAIVAVTPGVPERVHFNDEPAPAKLTEWVRDLEALGLYNKFVWPELKPAVAIQAKTDPLFYTLSLDAWYYSPIPPPSSSTVAGTTEGGPPAQPTRTCLTDQIGARVPLGSCPSVQDIKTILLNARLADRRRDCEAEWNCVVHSPLLKLALKDCGDSLHVSNCTSATILPEYNPTATKDSGLKIDRKVDFCITLSVGSDPGITSLVASIGQSINATSHAAYTTTPIAIPIETKIGGASEEEAELQLGIWLAAHLAKLETLVRKGLGSRGGHGVDHTAARAKGQADAAWNKAVAELDFLPAVMVLQHQWYFVAATLVEGRVRVWRKTAMGDTETPQGICRILYTLRKLAIWAEEEYWVWFEKWILGRSTGTES